MLLIPATVLVACVVTALLASPQVRRICVWGTIWGAVFAVWIVGPPFLEVHRLRPVTLGHWAILMSAITAGGALFGLLLSAAAVAPAGIVWVVRGRSFAHPVLAAALTAAIVVPASYATLSALFEVFRFGRVMSINPASAGSLALVALAIGAALALRVVYRRVGSAALPRATRMLRLGVAVLLVTGLAVLKGGHRVPALIGAAEPLLPPQSEGTPLVVIGLDGGNWKTFRPLVDAGRAPTLQGLIERGQQGTVRSAWESNWSGPAWATILTGQPPEVTGVFGDLAATAPGLPTYELPLDLDLRLNPFFALELALTEAGVIEVLPMPRAHLRYSPIWERAARAGRRVAVVRFPFTYPARASSSVVVSDRVSSDTWRLMGVGDVGPDEQINAQELTGELQRLFSERVPNSPLHEILPQGEWPWPANTPGDLMTALRLSVELTEKTFLAAERILKANPDLDVLMVYIGNVDSIQHAFWKFRFPEEFPNPPAGRDVTVLGPVIDRYLSYVDRRIGNVLGPLESTHNIVVVSDHGMAANPAETYWSGGHSAEGMIVAAGPGIARDSRSVTASHVDVFTTLWRLLQDGPVQKNAGGKLVIDGSR